jgi:hypothetical protein
MAKKTKAVKTVKTAPVAKTRLVPPTTLAQAVPPTQPEVFGSPANRPVAQTIGGIQKMPFPQG